MEHAKPQSAGGKATALIFRKLAIEKYYKEPNKCKECGSVILVSDKEKVSQVKSKKFCNSSCAASFNNKIPKRKKKGENELVKKRKPKPGHVPRVKLHEAFFITTKVELRNRYKTYQSFRSAIQRNARKIFFSQPGEKVCFCGYKNHIEVAHKKSVSSFGDLVLLSDINNISNLIGLCPNHHWEFDNGLLEPAVLEKI